MSNDREGVHVISNCTSAEQFVSRFHRFYDNGSIFIPTGSPVGVGSRDRFSIALATGETVLSGSGVVIESQTPESSGGSTRAAGMRVHFEQIDADSQAVFQWLIAAKKVSGSTGRHPIVAAPPPSRLTPAVTTYLVLAHTVALGVGVAAARLVWGGAI